MNKIPRYDSSDDPDDEGAWCHWSEVKVLIAQLNDARAQALAAVWLLPEDIGMQELQSLRREALRVFLGSDKQVIARLQDELQYAQQAQRPSPPGVNAVYGIKQSEQAIDSRYELKITKLCHASNSGLVIEVQLP